jgi:hypothetical protein
MNAVRCSKHSVLEACHFRCHIEPFSGSSGTDIVSVVSAPHPARYDPHRVSVRWSLSGEMQQCLDPETCPQSFLHTCLCPKMGGWLVLAAVAPDLAAVS